MCEDAGSPLSVSHALAMLHRALDHLNAADVASLPSTGCGRPRQFGGRRRLGRRPGIPGRLADRPGGRRLRRHRHPVVTGHVDWIALNRLVEIFVAAVTSPAAGPGPASLSARTGRRPTALPNLVPLCGFHHQIAVHRRGWALRLNPDGTTTATSPDRTRTPHSHGPPQQAV